MDNKLGELIEAAIKETERGKLEWVAFDSESFRAKIGAGYLHVQRGSTEIADDDRPVLRATYAVQVSDAEGRVVLEGDGTEGVSGCVPFSRLFEVARRSALRTDRVIDDMLQILRNGSRS